MRVEIVIFDGVDELDVIGPYEVFAQAARSGVDVEVGLVVLGNRDCRVRAANGLALQAEGALSAHADLVVLPGGGWADRSPTGVRAEIERGDLPRAVAACHSRGVTVAAVCTGAMALAAAGLLAGRPAVSHRSALEDLEAAGAIVVERRVVDDGDVVTCGGVTSGIDLGLHMVDRYFGAKAASEIARRLEYSTVCQTEPPEPVSVQSAVVELHVGSEDLGICRLEPDSDVPSWVGKDGWFSITRTAEELSIVCAIDQIPGGTVASGPWRAMIVAGPIGHDATGILASIAKPLAQAGLPIFAISTFDTDYVLVRAEQMGTAAATLQAVGHLFTQM